MVVHLKSGERRRYQVGRMNTQEGAIIEFIDQEANPYFVSHYGYGWSAHLPQALEQGGIHLR
jgi:hypothetical protein